MVPKWICTNMKQTGCSGFNSDFNQLRQEIRFKGSESEI